MRVVAEFTTEPFHGEDQEPPGHARAALRAAEERGLTCDFGPFGTAVQGEADVVVPALADVLGAALANGATQVTLQVHVEEQQAGG